MCLLASLLTHIKRKVVVQVCFSLLCYKMESWDIRRNIKKQLNAVTTRWSLKKHVLKKRLKANDDWIQKWIGRGSLVLERMNKSQIAKQVWMGWEEEDMKIVIEKSCENPNHKGTDVWRTKDTLVWKQTWFARRKCMEKTWCLWKLELTVFPFFLISHLFNFLDSLFLTDFFCTFPNTAYH